VKRKAPPKRQARPRALTLDDLTPDDLNLNRGTERGTYALETSLEKYGVGRGACADRNGKMIAGSHVLVAAREKGMDVQFVHTNGRTLVVTVRDDLDMDRDREARELAAADNRVSELSWNPDPKAFADLTAQGCDFTAFWKPDEIAELLERIPKPDGLPPVQAPRSKNGPADGMVRLTFDVTPEQAATVERALYAYRDPTPGWALFKMAEDILRHLLAAEP
jgi:pyruvate/2-oxoglutarate dehydrogenase complex dihydrolipoamide acyltransferase (E2) component